MKDPEILDREMVHIEHDRRLRNKVIEECAMIADDRAQGDRVLYKDETDWRMPYAFNRVVRAAMDIASAIRALKDKP